MKRVVISGNLFTMFNCVCLPGLGKCSCCVALHGCLIVQGIPSKSKTNKLLQIVQFIGDPEFLCGESQGLPRRVGLTQEKLFIL